MNTKKRNNPFQKSVEESILEAVTRLQKDEDSSDPFAGAKPIEGFKVDPPPSVPFGAPEFRSDQIEDSPLEAFEIKQRSQPISKGSGSEDYQAVQLKLLESDHLKIAQQRIEDLEREIERLRLENEKLGSATDLFQKRGEESLAAKQEVEKKLSFLEERFAEERLSFKGHIEKRDLQIQELKEKLEELENRLSVDVRKSRSRERELENRLELARMEKISLVGSKDEIILDLKRQVDQLNHEIGNYRRKTAEMNQSIEANQEQFRRTVRALRLALTNLEVNEQIGSRSKKAE
ncbi:MAG: hypothetical protein RJB66_853 [Pseudomonadota bacterium]|jgi:chromosome segregation ATPase